LTESGRFAWLDLRQRDSSGQDAELLTIGIPQGQRRPAAPISDRHFDDARAEDAERGIGLSSNPSAMRGDGRGVLRPCGDLFDHLAQLLRLVAAQGHVCCRSSRAGPRYRHL
jgi:hypothetical protein